MDGTTQSRENDGPPVAASQTLFWTMALMVGFSGLVTGLLMLAIRPLAGVLMVIAAMSALLYSADGFCQGPGVFRSMQSRK